MLVKPPQTQGAPHNENSSHGNFQPAVSQPCPQRYIGLPDLTTNLADGSNIRHRSRHGMQAENTTGASPLHDAASRGHSQVVRVLLLAGARAEATDQVGPHMVLHQPPMATLRGNALCPALRCSACWPPHACVCCAEGACYAPGACTGMQPISCWTTQLLAVKHLLRLHLCTEVATLPAAWQAVA